MGSVPDIQVLSIGTKVKIGMGEIPGVIDGICISHGRTSYKIIWWDGKIRREEWLGEHEIQCDNHQKLAIGFR